MTFKVQYVLLFHLISIPFWTLFYHFPCLDAIALISVGHKPQHPCQLLWVGAKRCAQALEEMMSADQMWHQFWCCHRFTGLAIEDHEIMATLCSAAPRT